MNKEIAVSKLKQVMRMKHFALATERNYIHWLNRFIAFRKKDRSNQSSEKNIESFLTYLARSGVSASTQNQAFHAIRFFYVYVLKVKLEGIDALRAKRPVHVRQAPSVNEVRAILNLVKDSSGYPCKLIVHMLYGCGLRVSEPLEIRIRDLELDRSRIIIRRSKGDKDRVVSIPCSLIEPIRRQVKVATAMWERDAASSIPVPLPDLLAKKYKNYAFSRAWYWLFPAIRPCKHPRTGETVRWRCHQANIQRAVKAAARAAGVDGKVTPHNLRHAYGTHMLESGVNPRSIQMAMGHSNLETTMTYLHSDSTSSGNPLDRIMVT